MSRYDGLRELAYRVIPLEARIDILNEVSKLEKEEDIMTEEKKPETRITPEELKRLKKLFTAIRVSQMNMQQVQLTTRAAAMDYDKCCVELAGMYGVDDEQFDIDRLTGVITIQPGKLPGPGAMMPPQGRMG